MLTLGGINFDGYSTPSSFPLGGKQAMAVHKLPGGSRVVDTLGPDEADIHWNGFFFSNDAENRAGAVDAMRAAGVPLPLIVEGKFRIVLINDFIYRYRRRPVWIDYEITCTVISNPSLGNLSPSVGGIDGTVQADLTTANSVANSGPAAAGNAVGSAGQFGSTSTPGSGLPGELIGHGLR